MPASAPGALASALACGVAILQFEKYLRAKLGANEVVPNVRVELGKGFEVQGSGARALVRASNDGRKLNICREVRCRAPKLHGTRRRSMSPSGLGMIADCVQA